MAIMSPYDSTYEEAFAREMVEEGRFTDKLLREALASFEKLLSSHDWTYDYSDDHRAYLKGHHEAKAIQEAYRELIANGLKPEADQLYQRYRRS